MIEFHKVNFSFEGSKILNDMSFKVEENDNFSISGASGSGKTSVLMLITGFLIPGSGHIKIMGEILNDKNSASIRKEMSWLPQNPTVIGKGNVQELIFDRLAFSGKNYGLDIIRENFAKLYLPEKLLASNFEQLSGGEKQRIGMIITKLLDRSIVLLDEPTSALDGVSKEIAAEYLLTPTQTIVSVSHDKEWNEMMNNSVKL